MNCSISLANRWIANLALRISSGNQEMTIKREVTMWGILVSEQYHVTMTQ